MLRRDVIAAHVEKLLETLTESERVTPDHDGDYPVRCRSALYYVRIVGGDSADVQLFAVAVDKVSPTPELLVEDQRHQLWGGSVADSTSPIACTL